ncbi:MAG: hypothetical protein SAK29_01280 [Scytonema sp. PMC 1069.18]|nr:hypothetical protein [Scytonema sp. PMC 1069.18]MEC4811907.1 hypothetical protein [Scytonema sp. PMC 1069.18]
MNRANTMIHKIDDHLTLNISTATNDNIFFTLDGVSHEITGSYLNRDALLEALTEQAALAYEAVYGVDSTDKVITPMEQIISVDEGLEWFEG